MRFVSVGLKLQSGFSPGMGLVTTALVKPPLFLLLSAHREDGCEMGGAVCVGGVSHSLGCDGSLFLRVPQLNS